MNAALQHSLHRETKAAAALRASLAAVTDDTDTIRDTIEGATSLHEMVRAVLMSIEEDQLMVDGCKARIADLSERKRRFEDRIETKRAMVEQAMQIGDITTLEMDVATVFLSTRQPKATATDEALIPSEFWEPQPPKLDTKKLLAALKDGRSIPGAALSNGSVSLTIRRK